MLPKRAVLLPLALCVFICSPLFATTRTWTGAVNANWSNPANWSPSGTPSSTDPLVFPKGALNRTMTNDLPAGTSVGAMSFFDVYILTGNALTLTGDLSAADVFGVGLTMNPDVTLGGPISISSGNSQQNVRFTGDFNLNGQTLSLTGNGTYIQGTLSGTGSIVDSSFNSGVLQIAGGGSFSGTIQTGLSNFSGSLPNAAVTVTTISPLDAVGTIGDLAVNSTLTIAGTSAGVLHTKSVLLNRLSVDVFPPASSDQLQATGTVYLRGTLQVQLQSGTPAAGQSYKIIDNEGPDPVVGTFTGLPEGAFLTVNGYSFQISYVGGDGNDVVLTAASTNKQWTGAVNANWSNPANWSPQGVPSPGEALVFPKSALNRAMNNDLPAGTSVGAMSFFDQYILSGNALTLTGDLSAADVFGVGLTMNPDVTLGGPISISDGYSQSYVRFMGDLNVNGQTLSLTGYGTYIQGTLSGAGSIIDGNPVGALQIAGGGSFSGTIQTGLSTFSGSLPNAAVTVRTFWNLDAIGTMGDLAVNGTLNIAGSSAGVLHTKSVLLNRLSIDLLPPASSDQLQAAGTVYLRGTLQVQLQSGTPAAGQSYKIIDNEGPDPVVGTFVGLPEGAFLAVNGYSFKISYVGGDGNDVVLTAVSLNKQWTGAASANWSDPSNWSPQGVPSPGQTLDFPKSALNLAMNNDLPAGTSVGVMSFFDQYILSGNALMLTGDLSTTGGGLTANADVKLGGPVGIGGGSVRFTGDLNVNAQTLTLAAGGTTYIQGTLSGTGSIIDGNPGGALQIAGGGSFSGIIQTGLSTFSGSLPNAAVTVRTFWNLDAIGTMGDLAVNGTLNIAGSSAGVLHTKSVLLNRLSIDLFPPASSDQLQAAGTVYLRGTLQVQLQSGTPAAGQSYKIIDNEGPDPVVGTFVGLPEGAYLTLNGYSFKISYVGGDGNDVVLRVLEPTATALSQGANESVFGQPVTLTAVVTSTAGTPAGTVFFTADGVSVGTAALLNGVGTIAVTTLPVGTSNIVAVFHGTGTFDDSTSNFVSHHVTRGQTTVTVVADPPSGLFGATIRLTASVSPVAPAAGAATGSVTFFADGLAIGARQLSNGTATLETSALHAGVRSITAAFGGDANFEGSTSSAIQQTISKAQTQVDARSRSALVGESPVITVFVNVVPGSALVPSGTVSISEGGAILGTQALSGGVANISLNPLSAGDHTLIVNYSGDTDFETSSETIVQTVGAPGLSIHGTRVLEGNRGITNVLLVVSLTTPVSQPVRVSFSTVAGSATAGEDFESASGVIEFAPGQLTYSIELHVIGDTLPESDETFSVLLSNPVNATIDTPSALIVIANDDQVPPRRRPSGH